MEVLGFKELFDCVVDAREGGGDRLDQMEVLASSRTREEKSAQPIDNKDVFKQVFIHLKA